MSATENPATSPSSWRSSGMYPIPARSRWCGVARVRSRPSSRTDPPTVGSRPSRASHSSVCPLPCTPATPRISPARTSNDTPSRAGLPSSPATVRSCTSSRTSPGLAGGLVTRSCTDRPTISEASSASLAVGGRWPTTWPRRMTVMTSAISWTSLSLCEMNTRDRPPARRSRMIRNSSSVSPGVSTEVGSSRMSTLASRSSALTISTRCWTPTGRSSTSASGLTCSPYCSDSSRTSRRVRRRSIRPSARVRSMPRVTFSATVNTGTSMKCWCTMPMPARIAWLGEPRCCGWPSIRISPSSGWVSPNRTFIRVVLPAPFSPSSAWIWPGSTVRSMWSLATRLP